MIDTNINELFDRVCACCGPAPGETICRCDVRRDAQVRSVATTAGISEEQAHRAIQQHERNLREEFGHLRLHMGLTKEEAEQLAITPPLERSMSLPARRR